MLRELSPQPNPDILFTRSQPLREIVPLLGCSELFEDSAIFPRVTSQPDGSRNFTFVINTPLYPYQFLRLLQLTAPSKETLGAFGTYSDWKMPDYTTQENQRLAHLHTSGLKEHWKLFETHRKILLSLLNNDGYRNLGFDRASPTNHHDFIRSITALFPEINNVHYSELLAHPIFGQDIRELTGNLRSFLLLKSKSKYSSKIRNRIVVQILNQYENGDEVDLQAELVKFCAELMEYAPYSVSFPEEEQSLLLRPNSLSKEERERFFDTSRTVPINNRLLRITPNQKNGQYHFDTEIVGDNMITPLLGWSTDASGKREWISQLPDEDVESVTRQFAPDQDPEFDEHRSQRLNTLTGLLTLAALSPEIITTWPDKMSLPGSTVQQPLREAQVPLLAIMRRKQLLSSPVADRLETFALQST